jgi:hypothetical protein
MRTLRWVLVAAVAVLVSCGGGSSLTQKSPIIDCEANSANVDAGTPTLWVAAGYCWGADRKVIMDIIIEMNPHLDLMNLQINQTIKLPIGNDRGKWIPEVTILYNADSYEQNGVEIGPGRYKVGDTGPGGGIIVYVDEAGFENSDEDYDLGLVCLTGTCHYLEMAPFDLENMSWQQAKAAAEAFSTPSANDWLLPSKDALNEMCKFVLGDTVNVMCNDNGHGSFYKDDGHLPYWSSYQGGDGTALIQYFASGIQDYYYKGENSLGVRPVRAF